VTNKPVQLDLTGSDAQIVGPPRSGRSCTLFTIAEALVDAHDVAVIGAASSPLRGLAGAELSLGRPPQHADLLQRLINLDSMGAPSRPRVLVVDDVDSFDDAALSSLWMGIAQTEHLRLIVSMEPRAVTGYHPLIGRIRQARRVLVLQPDDPGEFIAITGVRLPMRPGLVARRGLGVLLVDRAAISVSPADTRSTRWLRRAE
jgi:hypothetical protein